ncbi:hypothetical protein Q7P36_009915 [Cladosporium allicinum]
MTTHASNTLSISITNNELCTAFGIKISPNAQVVQIARNAGFKSLFIDLEHGWLTLAEASNLCNVGSLSGITPFVRVPYECGTGGCEKNGQDVQVPSDGDEVISFSNESGSTVFAMIESRKAVGAVEEIAAIEGVDVLLVGSLDLTVDCGIGGQFDSPTFRSLMEKVAGACKKHGKVFGVAGISDNARTQDWLVNTLGSRFMLAQMDLTLISAGARRTVAAIPAVRSVS